MPRPRVLHLTTTDVSLDWLLGPQLRAFGKAGFDVVSASSPGPHVASLITQGILHHEVRSLSRNVDPLADVRSVGELTRLLHHVRPDIIHTHNPKPGVIGRVLGRMCNVPIVVNTVHGLYAQPEDRLVRRAAVYGLERLASTCSDAELVQNVEDVATLSSLGVPNDRLHVLGNGIDLDRFRPNPVRTNNGLLLRRSLGIAPNTPVIGMVGRLVWEKGYRELFDAVVTLRETGSAPFAVVVAGPEEVGKAGAVDHATLQHMADRGVHFLGSRTDIEDVLASFDVFVLPSHREGFPRAAMEASAMGLPVVATDVRGCRQVVQHDETGFVVPVKDSHELAKALGRLLDDPDLRRSLGQAAMCRAHVEFDQERVIARTLAVYRALLRRKGIPGPQPTTRRYNDSIDLVATMASNDEARSAAA